MRPTLSREDARMLKFTASGLYFPSFFLQAWGMLWNTVHT